jgi:hypothetical protein
VNPLSGRLASYGVLLATLVGCGGSDLVLPSNGTPADLQLVNGNNQTGLAGTSLALPLEVKVVDDRGDPLSGHTVAFALGTEVPGARLDPTSARSGRDGIAKSRWTLGATSGTQGVVARVDRGAGADPLEVRFSATVAATAAERIAVASGNDQSGSAGGPLASPVAVRVTDGFGNPVVGVTVQWEAQNGSVDPSSSVTGADGLAHTEWTLGSSAGAQSVTATSSGLSGSPLTLTATALAGNPRSLERVSGSGQSGPPGTELGSPLVVRLLDDEANGVPGRPVSWVVATGGGSVSSATSTTDENGRASTQWTLGPVAGQNTLNAVVSGVGVVGFTATATSTTGGGGGGSSASRLAFQMQPSDTEKDKTITPPVEVVVLDANGQRVTEGQFEIMLELTGDDDGELKGDRRQRTRFGVATFDDLKVDEEGEYRLRASADGLPSVDSDRFEVHDD